MHTRHLVLAVLASVLLAGHAFGQVPTIPVKVRTVDTKISVTELDRLDEAVRSGNFTDAETIARGIVDAAARKGQTAAQGVQKGGKPGQAPTPPPEFDYTKNVLALVWASEESPGTFVLRRFHLPQPADSPNRLDLPGIGTSSSKKGFYELLLTGEEAATLDSVYSSVRQEDELKAQLPDFAARIASPLFGLLSDVGGALPAPGTRGVAAAAARSEQELRTLRVTAGRVMLPYERATIQVAMALSVPIPMRRVEEEAKKLAVGLQVNDLPRAPKARRYADDAVSVVVEVAKRNACTTAGTERSACRLEFDSALGALYKSTTDAKSLADDDKRGIEAVDAAFRKFFSGLELLRVEGRVSFRNRPLTRFALGLGAGVIAGTWPGKTRATVSGGNVAADPASRQMTMALVNIAFCRYDAEAYRLSFWEHFRGFAGAILTPDFGAGAGVSVLLVRGLAANVGGGVLFTRAVEDASLLGKPATNDPFVLGTTRILFAGLSYTFKEPTS